MPPPCPDPRDLADLFSGRLPLAEVDRLATHLEGCPACSRAASRLEAADPLAGLVRGLPAGGPGPDDPEVARLISTLRGLFRAEVETLVEGDDRPAPEAPEAVGSVGGYRIVGRLGAGGMGVVYLARQTRPDRPVALKVLTGAPGDGDRAARFRAEAEVAARLTHPHIVPVYEAGEDGGRLFIAMELAAGGSLAQRLAEAPLSAREAAGLLAPLARAVAFAHARGVIHRDLKPSNILLAGVRGREAGVRKTENTGSSLTSDSCLLTPKVGDFGLAKLVDADPAGGAAGRTETGALLGTPAYMAPEQAAGDRAVGPAADVYGLGAVLYECLTGRPPFKAASVLDTLDQVRRRDPVPVRRLQPGVPKDLETVCLKCLEKDPRRRYASADELADDLDRFAAGEPVRARPVGPLTRAAKWARRRPTAAALVGVSAASAAALAAVVGVYTARLREEVGRANAGEAAAERGRAEAAANYRASRDAIRKMLARFGPRMAADVPRVGELYRDQLEDALAFYRGVLDEAADPDPAVRLDAGKAWAEAGSLQYYLGRPGPAREYLDRAIALLEGLPAGDREESEARAALIHALNHRAQLTPRPGADEEAEGYLLRALAEHRARVAAAPADPALQNALARGESNLGVLYYARGQSDRAEAHYARAVAAAADLTARHPADRTLAVDAAGYLVNLGLLYASTKRPGPAADAFGRAEALLLPLVDPARPRSDDVTHTLVGAWINWGNLLRDGGDRKESLAKLDRAVELADAALAREPGHRDTRDQAYAAHGSRSHTLGALGRYAEAAADFDRVVDLADDRQRPGLRAERAGLLARTGQYGRAAAEALDLAPAASGAVLYNLACALALAAARAEADPALGPLAGQAAADGYAAAAVRLLRRLQADGYFQTPGVALHMAFDADLASLRSRQDYRALQTDLSGKPPR